MNAVVILPCPFCGDTDPSIDEIDNNLWAVVCNDCGAIGPHLTDDGGATVGAKAIELWNGRKAAADAQLTARADAIKLPGTIWLANWFHETYERLAPTYQYVTRLETKTFCASTPNGRLMIAVCRELREVIASRNYDGGD